MSPTTPRAQHPLADELRALARLALPITTAQVGLVSMGAVDTIMVGHLSDRALGGVALGNLYAFGLLILGQGVLMALDPVISQAHGAKDDHAVALALQRGLVMALALSIPFIIAFQFTTPVLRLFRQSPELIPVADQFVRALAPAMPPFFIFVVLRQSLQAVSIARPMVIAVVVGNLSNLFFNWVFIFGHLGAPKLGALGSAVSTDIGRYVMALVLAAAAWPELRRMWRPPTRELLPLAPYRHLLAIGIPTGVQYGLETWVFMTASLIIGTFSTAWLDAHQIAINLATLSFMVPVGIGAAAATRVGQAIGRRDPAAVHRAALTALLLGAAVMMVSALAFALMPRLLASLYTPSEPVIALAASLLPIAALFQILDGIQAVGCGVLRGAADTRAAAIINFIGYWVIALPLGLVGCFVLHLGPKAVWWGLTLGLLIVAVLLSARIRSRLFSRAPLPVLPLDSPPVALG